MKRIGIAVLVAVAAVVAFSSIASAEEIPIEAVENFPSQIIAGSEYDVRYRFNCTANESIPVAMYFVIGGPEIWFGDWSVSATVNGSDENVVENVDNAGNFILSYEVAAGMNDVIIRISSLPNVLPAAYTFTLELWSETVEVIPPEPEPGPEELPPEVEDELPPEVPPEDIPPEKPPEKPPTGGGTRETDPLSSGQIQLAVFVGAIGALGIMTMICVMIWHKRRRRKGGTKK